MVFSTTTLFKGIACPKGDTCRLTNCIYSHETHSTDKSQTSESARNPVADELKTQTLQTAGASSEPAAKRRKITYNSLAEKPPSRADTIRGQLAAVRGKSPNTQVDGAQASQGDKKTSQPPQTLVKPVSPPKVNATLQPNPKGTSVVAKAGTENKGQVETNGTRRPEKVESLNPRLIPNDPAGHQKRSLFLKHIHAEMVRLNKTMQEFQNDKTRQSPVCTEQELITMALDAEESIAKEQSTLYGNVVKQQITKLKKMKPDDWAASAKGFLFPTPPKPAKKEEKRIDTGLPLEQEHLILPHLVADQEPLAAFGYIPVPPTEQEAAEAAAAVETSANYEICDRCSARFQVFPERNEEGLLSSNGPCKFHPYRKVFPQKSKTDKETGVNKDPYYPCCHEKVGAPGCTRNEEHVFKTSSPARLAANLAFAYTPDNPSPARDRRGQEIKAVTFDCEMGYTVYGMELIRLTAVTWPSGEELLDILVRPLGAVIDLNSRFSGIFPEHFKNAIPYDDWNTSPPPPPATEDSGGQSLPIVDTPQRARELLCQFLTPKTPLLGHAIDNDLNTVRLCHPTIVDTVLLFAHPRGLPMRFGLKMLSQRHLHRAIQQGGDRGHDSKEDAVATGDLVRVKIGEKWRQLKASDWQIVDDQLVPPPPAKKQSAPASGSAAMEQDMQSLLEGSRKRKKRPSVDASEDSEGANGTDGIQKGDLIDHS